MPESHCLSMGLPEYPGHDRYDLCQPSAEAQWLQLLGSEFIPKWHMNVNTSAGKIRLLKPQIHNTSVGLVCLRVLLLTSQMHSPDSIKPISPPLTSPKYPSCLDSFTVPLHSPNACWRHQMKTFSALLALCEGNSPVTGEFPTQRSVTRTFNVFFVLRLNNQLSKQSLCWWFETPSRSLW